MALNKITEFIFYIMTACILYSCVQKIDKDFKMTPQLKNNLEKVQTMKVFFGHQSVGNNILGGLDILIKETGVNGFNILEWNGQDELNNSFLLHLKIGENTKPRSKCDAFASVWENPLFDSIDVAMMKFCYIDINENTDVLGLFEYYKSMMDSLKNRFPTKTFVHITVPLVHSPNGITVKLREWLGKPNRNKLANIKRNEFNDLLREYYKTDPVYDLAWVESTYTDGKRESFKMNGKTYFSLINAYASDGRHLNEQGSKMAAAELIRVLAGLKLE
jgi:hypothetical protein